jgi:hypothetical protein
MDVELTPAERGLLPTADDVRAYREHGWWISPRLFNDTELDAAIAGSERYYRGERDLPWPGRTEHPWGWKPEHGDVLRKSDFSSLQSRELLAIARKPLLAACAAILAGVDEIRLWHDQLLYKPVDDGEGRASVGWHTDRGYWQAAASERLLTAWVPFHDCDEAMGTVTMIDGSHRWPVSEGLNFFDPDLAKLETRFANGGAPVVKTPMVLSRGQVSFHSCLTIHGSGPNRSTRARRSLAVHLQDGENRYSRRTWPDGKPIGHGLDSLVRLLPDGTPDYADPAVCPTLWRGGEAAARGVTASAAAS